MTDQHAGRVWIVNHYTTLPSKDGTSGRHLGLARHLTDLGWDVSLLASSTTHPAGEQKLRGARLTHTSVEGGVVVRWIRSNAYRQSMPLRLIGMLVFAAMLLRPGATRGLGKPDVIVGSTVHPFAAWAASRLAHRHGVSFVYEIRDVWPETLIDMGQLSEHGTLAGALQQLSRSLCSKAALIISPLPHVDEYVSDLGITGRPFLWLSNGIEINDETVQAPPSPPHNDQFTLMYLGSHGNANGIDLIIDAFAAVVDERPEFGWRLRIVGDGPLKPALRKHAASLECADAISFEDRIPRSEVLARARQADCLVAVSRDHAVYRYGSSPNKLFDYLLAGRPVIRASNAAVNPVAESGAGFVVPAGDVAAISAAMVGVYELSRKVRECMGRSGHAHVVASYSYEALAEKLSAALVDVVKARRPHACPGGAGLDT